MSGMWAGRALPLPWLLPWPLALPWWPLPRPLCRPQLVPAGRPRGHLWTLAVATDGAPSDSTSDAVSRARLRVRIRIPPWFLVTRRTFAVVQEIPAPRWSSERLAVRAQPSVWPGAEHAFIPPSRVLENPRPPPLREDLGPSVHFPPLTTRGEVQGWTRQSGFFATRI